MAAELAATEQASGTTRDRTSFLLRVIAIAVFALMPIQILGEGYFPSDDALRHAAKAVSGRDWNQVVLLRPGTIDNSPGWHAILSAVHAITGADQRALVYVEVVSLFLAFSLGPLLLLRRVEAWVIAMLAVGLFEPLLVQRIIVGRPLILTMGVVVTLCLLWRFLDTERRPTRAIAIAAALIAASTWIHGTWYLFAIPIIAFFLAGHRRAALRLAAAAAIGVLVGALLTGHPAVFLWQTLRISSAAVGGTEVGNIARELRPYPGAPTLILAILLLVVTRWVWRGEPARTLIKDPVFVLGAIGWTLGLMVARFWLDWGLPALTVFIAIEIQALLPDDVSSRRRLALGGVAALLCFLVLTGDVGRRWSGAPRDPAYRAMITPEHRTSLPDPGGILYADDMQAFYDLFFLLPNAPWKYSTGYEPGLMPPEDLAVYRRALLTQDVTSFEPWVRKMKPADRLVIHYDAGIPPIDALEWQSLGYARWSGRLKRGSR